jgi:hypothetical protein
VKGYSCCQTSDGYSGLIRFLPGPVVAMNAAGQFEAFSRCRSEGG